MDDVSRRDATDADEAMAGGAVDKDGAGLFAGGAVGSEETGDEGLATPEEVAAEPQAALAGAAEKAAGAARRAAAGAAGTLRDGVFAMRDVHNASRRSASARSQAKSILDALETDRATLEHRRQVEADYGSIVSAQTREVEDSQARISTARKKSEAISEEHAALVSDLAELKASHAAELRPYKRLAETAKGELDDATRMLAEAKRALKTAEAQVKDATERRDSQVSSASRSLDNAQTRQRKVQDELKHAQAAGSPSVGKLQSENVAALAAVTNAKAEVDRAMKEGQGAVENAQTHLWTQSQSMESAQRAAQDAQAKYKDHKQDYDRRAAEAQAKESELQGRVDEKKRAIEALAAEIDQAQEALNEAQGLLDEAVLIHSTPEETERLEKSVEAQRAELAEANDEAEHLAQSEKALREATRGKRAALIAAAVLLCALVAFLAISCAR